MLNILFKRHIIVFFYVLTKYFPEFEYNFDSKRHTQFTEMLLTYKQDLLVAVLIMRYCSKPLIMIYTSKA